MFKSFRQFKLAILILGSALMMVFLFQNCASDFNVDEYDEVQQSSTEPTPEVPPEPVALPPPPPPPPALPPEPVLPPPPPPPAFQDYSGTIAAGDFCPNCAFENRSDTPPINSCGVRQRFLINNTPESVNRRCQELGWDYGQVQQVFVANEWCNYCNARTRTWNGSSWQFGNCVNGNVKVVRCYRN